MTGLDRGETPGRRTPFDLETEWLLRAEEKLQERRKQLTTWFECPSSVQLIMASNLIAMASNLLAMASNLLAMAFHLVASLLLVAMHFVTSSFLFLVVMPGAASSFDAFALQP